MKISTGKQEFLQVVTHVQKVGRLRCGCGARVWVNSSSTVTWLRDYFVDEHWAHGSMEFETQPASVPGGHTEIGK